MKRFARVITLLLAVALVCSLVGCKPAGGNQGGGSGEINLEGKKVKIAAWFTNIPKADAVTEEERLMYQQYVDAMAKYNFEFEDIIVNQIDMKTNFDASLMSGDTWADIIVMRSEQADVYAKKGSLKDVSQLMHFDSEDFEYNQAIRERYTKDGKTYAWSFDVHWLSNILFYNKDHMDRAGLEYPTKLFNEGKWDWAKFEEYVTKLTKKESDGYVATYGLYMSPETGYIDNFVVSAIGKSMVYLGDDGKAVYGANDPEYQAMANKVRDLMNSGNCYVPSQGMVGSAWSDAPEKFMSGKISMYSSSMAGGPDTLNESEVTNWGVVPFPAMNAGDEFTRSVGTINVRFIPASVSDDWAKKVATVYEAVHKSPYASTERAAAKKASIEAKVPDKDSIDLVYKYQYAEPAKSIYFAKYLLDDNVFYPNIEKPWQAAMRKENTIAATEASFVNTFKNLIDTYNASLD